MESRATASKSATAIACASRSAAGEVFTRGSIVMVNGCAYVRPPTVNRTVYVPGKAHGPRGSRGVSNGAAEMG